MKFKFLEHTADVKFQASGKSLEEAFENAFYALKESICGKIKIKPVNSKIIRIKGNDLNSMLYDFLEEFLFLLDSEGFLLSSIQGIKIDEKKFMLSAEVFGDKAKNYKFSNRVKAITYNEMFIKFNPLKKEWVVQVVVDV
ncbi:MAG: archease [Candidatus Nanoarchaeia archaeon]|nr:archease [Candidatus Nanoarchaeia archaeon]